jgi:cytochrome c-type biogenesis protein
MEVRVSFPLAFAAGVLSFLSPCILPVVPSYLAFVSGLTLGELREGGARAARIGAAIHSTLFMLGFGLVFMTMGLVATTAGTAIAHALPWISRLGGAVMIVFGLILAGLVRVPVLARDLRPHLTRRPGGALGALVVGVAFGAGWTPCIGPILGSVLLYAGLEATRIQGTLLLATYAFGLGIPFVAASVGVSWLMAGSEKLGAWMVPLQRLAGTVLTFVGFMMLAGQFARLTAYLAGLGQLINLDIS